MGVGRATGVVECTQRLKTFVLRITDGITPSLSNFWCRSGEALRLRLSPQ